MKRIYTLTTSMMNGSVTMASQSCSFQTRELAELAKKAVDKANAKNEFSVFSVIEECPLYESADEVPILNNNASDK